MLYTQLGILHLLWCNERVPHTAAQLRHDRIIHRLVLIAEQDGAKPHIIVNVFIAVRIPDVPILAMVDIDGRHALDMRLRPFTVELAARENGILCPLPQFI